MPDPAVAVQRAERQIWRRDASDVCRGALSASILADNSAEDACKEHASWDSEQHVENDRERAQLVRLNDGSHDGCETQRYADKEEPVLQQRTPKHPPAGSPDAVRIRHKSEPNARYVRSAQVLLLVVMCGPGARAGADGRLRSDIR